jgi:hypothetical protein
MTNYYSIYTSKLQIASCDITDCVGLILPMDMSKKFGVSKCDSGLITPSEITGLHQERRQAYNGFYDVFTSRQDNRIIIIIIIVYLRLIMAYTYIQTHTNK